MIPKTYIKWMALSCLIFNASNVAEGYKVVVSLKFTWIYSRSSVTLCNVTSIKRVNRHIGNTSLINTTYVHLWGVSFPMIPWTVYLIKCHINGVTHHSEDRIFYNNLILLVNWRASCNRMNYYWYVIGAVINVIFPDVSDETTSHTTRTVKMTECDNSQMVKEALAIIWAIKMFHKMIFEQQFTSLDIIN